jgi:hypothetical protein
MHAFGNRDFFLTRLGSRPGRRRFVFERPRLAPAFPLTFSCIGPADAKPIAIGSDVQPIILTAFQDCDDFVHILRT